MVAAPKVDKLTKFKILAVAFLILAFVTYSLYLDILIPGLPSGSERESVGPLLFLIPCFLLAGGQLLIGGFIIFTTIPAVSKGKFKIRMWQSMALGSYLTFMFSLTYAAYPFRGPVYYAAFVGNSAQAILFEAAWAAFSIISTAWVIRRLDGAKWKYVLFTAGLSLLVIIVSAS